METKALEYFTTGARYTVNAVADNCAYVIKHLHEVNVTDEHALAIREAISELIGIKHDMLNELNEIQQLDPAIQGEHITAIARSISGMLWDGFYTLDNVVQKLRQTSETVPDYGGVFILVGETAMNIHQLATYVTRLADQLQPEDSTD